MTCCTLDGFKKLGVAVNANGSLMAVSFLELHELRVFALGPGYTFAEVSRLGRYGTGDIEFGSPCRLCFTDGNYILVADRGNRCVYRRVPQFWTQ